LQAKIFIDIDEEWSDEDEELFMRWRIAPPLPPHVCEKLKV
jgi:hypothetical protein